MSCSVGIQDIEDLVNDLDNSIRKSNQNGVLKRKVKVQNGNEEYDKEFIEQIPGTQKIFVKTFGCSHNISDSEFMMGQLAEYGYKIVDKIDEADLILINSCTVKNPSQDAFIGMVNTAKKANKFLVVAGCVPQGERHIPEIENISTIGVTQIDRVVEVVNETFKGNTYKLLGKKDLPTLDLPKIRRNKFIEIITINSGCLGSCTYCKTVQARGKLGSYSIETLIERMKQAISEGVREIWLTSEDTGAYGRDIGTNISILLKTLANNLPKDIMLRIGMTNPPYIMEHLSSMAEILNHPNVYSFLHVPVQSGNNKVLTDMNREYTVEEFQIVCDYLLKNVPGISLATDIICGFPGETNEEFESTLDLIKKYKFPVINISQFYPRPGTPAAKMKRVNTKDVKERSTKLTRLFESYKCYDNLLNTKQKVWISDKELRKDSDLPYLVGHTKNYVKVMLKGDISLIGKSVCIFVNKTLKWHIEGEIIQNEKNEENEIIPEKKEIKLKKNSEQEYKIDSLVKFGIALILMGIIGMFLNISNFNIIDISI